MDNINELDKQAADQISELMKDKFTNDGVKIAFSQEDAHIAADKIISELILKLGCKKTYEKYKEIEQWFWYA